MSQLQRRHFSIFSVCQALKAQLPGSGLVGLLMEVPRPER